MLALGGSVVDCLPKTLALGRSSSIPRTENKNRKTSAFGIAHEYANPELIPLEKETFANAMAEKHVIT